MTVPLRALETSTGPQNQRKTMSRIDQIHQNLQKLVALTPDLEGALLVTLDGLPSLQCHPFFAIFSLWTGSCVRWRMKTRPTTDRKSVV